MINNEIDGAPVVRFVAEPDGKTGFIYTTQGEYEALLRRGRLIVERVDDE